MKKKLLVIPVFLLAFALLSIPVMAAPATKIEASLTAVVSQTPSPGFPRTVSDGTILHGKGTSSGTVTLNIGLDTLVGVWEGEFVTVGKLKHAPTVAVIRGKLVWTFTGGTFEGIVQRTIIGYPPGPSSIFEDHLVLHGTGVFQGQTLKLSYEGTPPLLNEGYLLMPK